MIFEEFTPRTDPLFQPIIDAYRMDETVCVEQLVKAAQIPRSALSNIMKRAIGLVQGVRDLRLGKSDLDAFMQQYDLSSQEGITLMCLAEALLRIPDKLTIDQLIKDKITPADWAAHKGRSSSLFVNAATWGLMLTGRILQPSETAPSLLGESFERLLKRTGMPVIRKMVLQSMKILGEQFVMGRTIDDALERAYDMESLGYCYSYDMLGEAAHTQADADRYFHAYEQAIIKLGEASQDRNTIESPGISIKLSALHPRYEFAQHQRVQKELAPRLLSLALKAKQVEISLTVDAEEADRLDISLNVIEEVFSNPSLAGWEGFGLAVQSYQKRAIPLLEWLAELSVRNQRRLMVRLIKGAYWDSEIKHTQEFGLASYPVFTRKPSTDVSFIACAKKILEYPEAFYPMFATHNAHTVATVLELVGDRTDFEFQCLHGMGEPLYDQIVGIKKLNHLCRMYAPVGQHEDLLPYLVRRLLENGANSSFVNRIVDETLPIEAIIADPITFVDHLQKKPHPQIPLPKDLYGDRRENSQGIDLTCQATLVDLKKRMQAFEEKAWIAQPIIGGVKGKGEVLLLQDPSDQRREVGKVQQANAAQVDTALEKAHAAFLAWDTTPIDVRATCLRQAANLFEAHRAELMTILIREAGKTLADAVSEIREAVDFCRYYAEQAEESLVPKLLPGPTGEANTLHCCGRGIIACISPWNFPLAIFIGQVVAALVAGNCVIAKPAEQTPIVAAYAVDLLHEAGIPVNVLHFLPGTGEVIGARLVADLRVKGVLFTGSTETARLINQTLAEREGPIVPLIAETGGQNAMIVDSSALPEQVVQDVIGSAFGSAGQRCSALRVLFVQDDIAEKLLTMLKGAMAEIRVGDPGLLATDLGPVIDEEARGILVKHADAMTQQATLLYKVELDDQKTKHGTFFAPQIYELENLSALKREVFGPILHVIRFANTALDEVIDSINSTGYGLTLGIHTRIDEKARYIEERVHVGNTYVNRNMIGAVVGVQPFGGEGLSGTGPKAGGPHYLPRLCVERTIAVDTTAAGGNASLLTLNTLEDS